MAARSMSASARQVSPATMIWAAMATFLSAGSRASSLSCVPPGRPGHSRVTLRFWYAKGCLGAERISPLPPVGELLQVRDLLCSADVLGLAGRAGSSRARPSASLRLRLAGREARYHNAEYNDRDIQEEIDLKIRDIVLEGPVA